MSQLTCRHHSDLDLAELAVPSLTTTTLLLAYSSPNTCTAGAAAGDKFISRLCTHTHTHTESCLSVCRSVCHTVTRLSSLQLTVTRRRQYPPTQPLTAVTNIFGSFMYYTLYHTARTGRSGLVVAQHGQRNAQQTCVKLVELEYVIAYHSADDIRHTHRHTSSQSACTLTHDVVRRK